MAISRAQMGSQMKGNRMPMTKKGKKIMGAMKEQYGPERGEEVFYASANKGTIKGVEKMREGGSVTRGDGACMRGHTKGRMT